MPEDRGLYSPILMDHLAHPRNTGEMESPDGVGEVKNPACGDIMRLYIKVEADRIVDAKFLTYGCGPSIAASSMTTEMIKGKSVAEVLTISKEAITEALGGLPPAKSHCSALAEKAVKAAVFDYQNRS
jgi:nitrogen fixation NifU-like protein